MFYWAENEKVDVCKTCGVSRWEVVKNKWAGDVHPEKQIRKVLAKLKRYFSLKSKKKDVYVQGLFRTDEMACSGTKK